MSERQTKPLPGHNTAGVYYTSGLRAMWLVGGIISVLVSIPLRVVPAGLVAGTIGLLMWLPATNRRVFTFTAVAEFFRNRRLRRRRGVLAPATVRQILIDDEGAVSREPVIPISVNFIPTEAGEFLSEIQHEDSGMHSIPILIDSWGEAATAEPETMGEHLARFREVLELLANRYGFGLRVALFFQRVPVDPTRGLEWFENHRFISDDEAIRHMQEDFRLALEAQVERAGNFVSGAMVTVSRPKAWSKYKLHEIPFELVSSSKAWQLTQLLIDGLEDIGVRGVRRANPYETAILLRGNLDIAGLPQRYLDWYLDRQLMDSEGFDPMSDSLLLADGAFPAPHEIVGKRNHLQVGSTFSKTFYAPNFRRRRVPVGYFQQLFAMPPSLWAGITIHYETTDAAAEQRRSNLRYRNIDYRRLQRSQKGASQRAEDVDLEQQVRETDEALFATFSDTLRVIPLASVSSNSLETLDIAAKALQNQFRNSVIPLRSFQGDSVQWEARLAALGLPTF